jgi:hypothetical protein
MARWPHQRNILRALGTRRHPQTHPALNSHDAVAGVPRSGSDRRRLRWDAAPRLWRHPSHGSPAALCLSMARHKSESARPIEPRSPSGIPKRPQISRATNATVKLRDARAKRPARLQRRLEQNARRDGADLPQAPALTPLRTALAPLEPSLRGRHGQGPRKHKSRCRRLGADFNPWRRQRLGERPKSAAVWPQPRAMAAKATESRNARKIS